MSAGIYASTLENVDKILKKYNALAEESREHMLHVNQFMRMHNFPLSLMAQIR
jgi:hypothetical protein